MNKVTLHLVDETDPATLWCHFERRPAPQPCYLQLDPDATMLRTGTVTTRAVRVTPRVRAGLSVRWPIPLLTSAAANTLVRRARPVAEDVVAGGSPPSRRWRPPRSSPEAATSSSRDS